MANKQHNHNDNNKELQPLLVLGPPFMFPTFEAQNLHNYRFLNAFSSQIPLHQFLAEQNVDPSSIQAILCSPRQKISADAIRLLPSLSLIVTTSNGTRHIDLAECSYRGIQVASIPGDQLAVDVADMTVGLLIDVMWNISAADRHLRKWGPSKPCNLSSGSKYQFPGSQSIMAMAEKHNHIDNKEIQPLLVFGPPLIFPTFEARNFHKYRFLKAFSSQLPLHQFLTEQNVDPSSIQAILCSPSQQVSTDVIQLLPSLCVIVTSSAGTDHIDLVECSHHGIQVVSVPGDQAKDVADMAVGLLIDVLWKISAADRHVRKWGPSMHRNLSFGSKLKGKRVGIVGLGKIGKEVAKRLEPFGCRIMYHSRNQKPFISYPFYSKVVELAGNSDVLVLCCPLNEQSRHLINREVMLALGKDGAIVNVGRGALIDEKELVRCLMEDEIRGAGLDVFENEPNVPNELFPLDNVVLSPHAASLTSDGFTEVCELAAEALELFFSSKLPSIRLLDG